MAVLIYLLVISAIPYLALSCEVLKPGEHFDVELTMETADCSLAGSDALLLLYLPSDDGHMSYPFKSHLGPFQVYSDHSKLERNQTTFQTITWNEIKAAAGSNPICWPALETVILERRRYVSFIPEILSAWKPASIKIAINGTRKAEVFRQFSPNCNVQWIDEIGFYQIGPASNQLQMISDDKNEVFV